MFFIFFYFVIFIFHKLIIASYIFHSNFVLNGCLDFEGEEVSSSICFISNIFIFGFVIFSFLILFFFLIYKFEICDNDNAVLFKICLHHFHLFLCNFFLFRFVSVSFFVVVVDLANSLRRYSLSMIQYYNQQF